jgi:hypothetical protein
VSKRHIFGYPPCRRKYRSNETHRPFSPASQTLFARGALPPPYYGLDQAKRYAHRRSDVQAVRRARDPRPAQLSKSPRLPFALFDVMMHDPIMLAHTHAQSLIEAQTAAQHRRRSEHDTTKGRQPLGPRNSRHAHAHTCRFAITTIWPPTDARTHRTRTDNAIHS